MIVEVVQPNDASMSFLLAMQTKIFSSGTPYRRMANEHNRSVND
jgi:hypothetical protein